MKLSPKAQASLDKVINKFRQGDLSAITKLARMKIDPQAPVFKWSFSNKILAYVQSEEIDCRGFRQWEAVGRRVKKGSKAIYILRPILINVTTVGEDEEELVCTGYATVPVFPITATEGEETLPAYIPRKLPPLYTVAQKFGISIDYLPLPTNRIGSTDREGKYITLGSHEPSVFFHELAHAIHARIEGGLKGGQHVTQETIAEFTAVVLMDLYNMGDTSGNAWNYISMYSKDPLKAINKSLGTVEKILQELLND